MGYAEVGPTAADEGRPMAECLAAVEQLAKLADETLRTAAVSPGVINGGLRLVHLRQWLSVSVERFVFTQVGAVLWHMYEDRHSAEDARFEQKVQAVRVREESELVRMLEVPAEMLGVAHDADNTCVEMGLYDRAAAGLSQIEMELRSGRGCTPRRAIEEFMLTQLEFKECALQACNGQMDLSCTDDVLRLFVFVLLRSAMLHPFACWKYMQDAISTGEWSDAEAKVVSLLVSAARYVAYEWTPTEAIQ